MAAPRALEVVVGDDGLVRVPDDQNPPPTELSDVFLPPLRTKLIANKRSVVSFLQESGGITVKSRLSVVTSIGNALVIEDGAGEDPGGGLHQVPDPGVARAREGD